jgi:hypothetical protein
LVFAVGKQVFLARRVMEKSQGAASA